MVAVATLAEKRQGKKAFKTLKILNNFGSAGCQNSPRAAKLNSGVSKPQITSRTPRKRSKDGSPCKKAQGKEESFLFCLNQERAHAVASAKAIPPSIATNKHDDPYDRGGGPKALAKGGHSIEVKTINRDNLDDNEITSLGARKPAPLQASAATAFRGPSVTRLGRAGAIRRGGGAGMQLDNNLAAAA